MLVTDKQAKEKFCCNPYIIQIAPPKPDLGFYTYTKTNRLDPSDLSRPKCDGSACMAWRWDNPNDGRGNPDEWLGYCGKAGSVV